MIDIVMITAGTRFALLTQSLASLKKYSISTIEQLILVSDGWMPKPDELHFIRDHVTTFIVNVTHPGASAARNCGANLIPSYRRSPYLMFCDDDVYACPGWDQQLLKTCTLLPNYVLSGHAHPYNHPLDTYRNYDDRRIQATAVLSTVQLFMCWKIWDQIGYFALPGGPGGSEDVDWSKRATAAGYGLAVTDPMCIVHTGLTGSSGTPLIGQHLVIERNREIEKHYHIEGVIQYA